MGEALTRPVKYGHIKEKSMNRIATFASALSLLTAGAVVGRPAAAAPAVEGFTGTVESGVAGCSSIDWRLARHGNEVNGIFYYSDMTGTSQATGTMDQAGHFQMTLTSIQGQGPVASVTGTKFPNGSVAATMAGEGCANAKLEFNPVNDLRKWNPNPNAGWTPPLRQLPPG
jgi:hypothetical protein